MTPQEETGEVMAVKEVAGALRLAPSTVYRLVSAGKLRAYRVGPRGGSVRVLRESFREYVESSKTAA